MGSSPTRTQIGGFRRVAQATNRGRGRTGACAAPAALVRKQATALVLRVKSTFEGWYGTDKSLHSSLGVRTQRRISIRIGPTIAVMTFAPVVGSTRPTSADATVLPTCSPTAIQTMVVFNGPGNPYGNLTLSSSLRRLCSLSGRPTIHLFTSSGKRLAFVETPYHWTPSLPTPSGPIVITPSQPWAIVEMDWCGFPQAPRRMTIAHPGWRRPVVIPASTFAPSFFRPPSCAGDSTNRLALDVTRKLGPGGITGRVPTVTISPAINLHDRETVVVSVRGFDIGGKIFLSECATAADANMGGCGEQLAAQPFGLTGVTGSGRYTFTVSNRAGARPYDSADMAACHHSCVLVATGGLGSTFASAPLRFRSP